jgi:hypothetical protein
MAQEKNLKEKLTEVEQEKLERQRENDQAEKQYSEAMATMNALGNDELVTEQIWPPKDEPVPEAKGLVQDEDGWVHKAEPDIQMPVIQWQLTRQEILLAQALQSIRQTLDATLRDLAEIASRLQPVDDAAKTVHKMLWEQLHDRLDLTEEIEYEVELTTGLVKLSQGKDKDSDELKELLASLSQQTGKQLRIKRE